MLQNTWLQYKEKSVSLIKYHAIMTHGEVEV